ncbi:MAG: hypothetical protein WC475_03685 [Candidatus Paceibacterota bacterium]
MSLNIDKDYLNTIKERGNTGRVHKKFQFTGLTIAGILGDEKHKSLYIKMAQKYDEHKLITTAKSVAERKNIQNKGAYFMKVFHEEMKNIKK